MSDSNFRAAGAAGTPFLSVYLDHTSFVYDEKDGYVYVSPGGYGEPVTDRFEVPDFFPRLTVHAALPTFEVLCQKYLDDLA